MLLLLRALGASAFQCATRPSTDSWRTNVARVPAVAMDLTPEPELDEAMKAMQEVNELRAQLEASTAKLKKFTLPDPVADIPSPPAAIVADPADTVKAVEAAGFVGGPVEPPMAVEPLVAAVPAEAVAPLEVAAQVLMSEPAASVSAAAQAESAVPAMSAPEVAAAAQGAGEAAAQMASAAQGAGEAAVQMASAARGATGAVAEALHAIGVDVRVC